MLPQAAPRPAVRLIFALCVILTAASLGASLATTPTWTFASDQPLSQLGYSVAVADVNSDGYADLISGAIRYQPGGLSQGGRVQAFYGSATGLSPFPNWIIDATNVDDFLGISLANAGDVNGDGYPDILVGVGGWDNGPLTNAGQVRLYAGGPAGLVTTPLWTATSDQSYAILGSIGTIGDVNGDGYDDVATGAQAYDNPDDYEGRVTVHYGGPAGPSSAPDWMQEGNLSGAAFSSVAGGDINGDGYSDLLVGAPGYGGYTGRIFVYAGSSSGLSTTPMSTVDGQPGETYGIWLTVPGDVNGDGYDDVAIGDDRYGSSSYEGRAWVHLGSPSGLSASPAWQTNGFGSDEYGVVHPVGDVNQDGYDDVMVGSMGYGDDSGAVYLYAGSAGGLSTGPLWSAFGAPSSALGQAFGAGDFNGDGQMDVAVGANWASQVVAYYDCSPPSAPAAASVTEQGVLSWNAPSGGGAVDHYDVYTDKGSCSYGIKIAEVPAGTTTHTHPGHTENSFYYVIAVGADGCVSPRSNCAHYSTSSCEPPVILNMPEALCPYGASGDAATEGAYATYSWSIQNGELLTPSSEPSIAFRSTSYDAPVRLSVIVTNQAGCSSFATKEVPTRSIAPPVILNMPEALCPYGASGDAATEGAYATYSWSVQNGDLLTPSSEPSIAFRSTAYDAPVRVSVIVTDQGGCQSFATKEIPSRSIAPPVILNMPEALCPYGASGDAATEGAYATYSWSVQNGELLTPSSEPSISFRSTSYDAPVRVSVIVTDHGGCQSFATKEIPLRSIAPPVILNTPAALCPYGAAGSATTEGPYATYSWAIQNGELLTPSGEPSVSFHSTSSTDPVRLSVIVTDHGGCQSFATKEIPLRSIAPPVILNTPAALCPYGASGDATTEGPYATYSWAIQNGELLTPSGEPSVSFRSTSSTDPVVLSVIVTDTGGCQSFATKSIPIRTIPPPLIEVAPASLCENGTSGTASVDGTYSSYAWSVMNGQIIGGSNGATVSFYATSSAPVEVSVIVTDVGGCSSSASKSVPIRTIPPPLIEVAPPSLCENGTSGTASVDGAYSSYAWSVMNGQIIGGATGPTVSFYATSSTPVEVSVIVTDAGGCSSSASKSVPIRTIPPPLIEVAPASLCENGTSGTASVSGTYSSYAWSVMNGQIIGGATGSSVSFYATSSAPVQVGVIVTDAGGCRSSASTSVPIRTIPPPLIDVEPESLCANGAPGTASVAGAYSSYTWSVTNGQLIGAANGPSVSFYATSSTPVQVSVSVTDAGGCAASSSATVPVSSIAAPEVTPSGPTSFCEGGSVVLSAPAGFASYDWSNGATTESIVVTQHGNYSVTVTNAAGCSAQSAATTVVVSAIPDTPTITADGPATFCDGGSVTLTVDQGGYGYLWSNGAETQSITVPASGNYTVTIFGMGGCSATSAPFTVTELAPLTRPTITANGPTTFCAGGSVEVTANVSGGSGQYSYQWFTTGSPIPGATSRSYVATGNPSYVYVQVTDSAGCVSETSQAQIFTVKPLPDATITASASACASSTQSASVPSAGNGATYDWTITGGTITGTMSSAVFFTAGPSGAVTLGVTVTNGDGCSSSSSTTVAVTALPDATITPSGPTTFCDGGSVTLTAPAGMSHYYWSNGQTGPSITVGTSGTFNVTVTNANGCATQSADVVVTENAALPKPSVALSGAASFCPGGSVTLTATPSGGSGGYSFQWYAGGSSIGGATSAAYTATASGSYHVVVTDSLGCASTPSDPVAVTANANPSATITAPAELCASATGNASVPDAGTGATYNWQITGGSITANNGRTISFTAGASGSVSLSVTVTTAAGCSATSSTSVTINPNPSAAITAPASLCANAPGTASVPDAGAGATYNWQITNGTITSANGRNVSFTAGASGSVSLSVTVTTAAGCSATGNASIAINPAPSAAITAPSALCANAAGAASVPDAGAGATYNWQITNGTITSANGRNVSFTAGASGSVSLSVTVTTAAGCSATSSTPIAISPIPSAVITTPSAICANATGNASVPDAGAGATYNWQISGGTITSANGRNVSFTAGASGSVVLTVTVTTAAGCSATSSTAPIAINPQPSATITAPASLCAGTAGTASVPDAGAGATYNWQITNGTITSANGRNLSYTAGSGGTMTLSVTVTTAAGCSTTSTKNVTVNAATTITTQPQSITIPRNSSTTLSVVASGTGTLTYRWYRGTSGNVSNPITGTAGAGSSLNTGRLNKGTYPYWVRVTSPTCGSVDSNTATVSVP